MKKKNWLIICVVTVFIIFTLTGAGLVKDNEKQPTVNMTLFATDLREALNEISMQTGINIIPDQTVSGVVTADLVDVPLEKALRMILMSGGFTYRKIDDFYFVGLADPESRTFGELSEVKVIRLNHVTTQEVLNLMPSFLINYVNGNENMEGNKLTIQAPPKQLDRIEKLIKEIDKAQKMVEVKVVVSEVDIEEAKTIGSNLLNYDEGESGTDALKYDSESNLLTLETDYYGQLISKLKLLEEKQKAKIEADPRVLVADGQSAELFIGEQQVLLLTSEEEDFYTTRTEEIEVGVGLKVNADISGKDEVNLTLTPEISHFISQSRPDIIVKKNKVSTSVRVKSGETILLSGMTMEDNNDYQQKVPLLGDIPFVRWLFKSETKSRADRELMIFVTPVIQE